MDVELKAKWVKALRSGEYKQGRGYLRQVESNSFCCLGVLCDIIDPENWRELEDMYSFSKKSTDGSEYYGVMPPETKNMAGVSADEEQRLMEMNDNKHNSFEEIAGYIEKNM